MLSLKRLSILAAAGMFAIWGSSASAATADLCSNVSPDATNALWEDDSGTNDGCNVLLGDNNNNDTNVDLLFGGTDDWTQLTKVDGASGSSGGLTITSTDGKSGTWAISQSIIDTYGTVILLFKDGTQSDPSNIIAYLVNEDGGGFGNMFFNKNNEVQATSHYSIYVASPIPLPAAGFLMLGALGGLGLMRRRKKAA